MSSEVEEFGFRILGLGYFLSLFSFVKINNINFN